ncbi:MAG: hypothetical protein PHR00_02860 [Patescibacteria group bacterium]|nr:hypothetical protein [Patescibacteria group bacterium]
MNTKKTTTEEWSTVEQNDCYIVYETKVVSPSKAISFISEICILKDCDLGGGTYEDFFQTFTLIKDTAKCGLQFFINAAFGEDQDVTHRKVFDEDLCFLAFETEQCTIGSYMLYCLEAKKGMVISYQSSHSWTDREKKLDENALEIIKSNIELYRKEEKRLGFNFKYLRELRA